MITDQDHHVLVEWLNDKLQLSMDSTDSIKPADPAKWMNFMIYCFKRDAGTLGESDTFDETTSYLLDQADLDSYRRKHDLPENNPVIFNHWKNSIEQEGLDISSAHHNDVVILFMKNKGLTQEQIDAVLAVQNGKPPLLYHLVDGKDNHGNDIVMCQCWMFFPINNQNPMLENLIRFGKAMSFIIFPIALGLFFYKKFVLKDQLSGNLKKFFEGNAGFHHADYEGFTLTFDRSTTGQLTLRQLECHQHGSDSEYVSFHEGNQPRKLEIGFAANGHATGTKKKFWMNKHVDRSDMAAPLLFEPTEMIAYTKNNLSALLLPQTAEDAKLDQNDFINLGAKYPLVQRLFLLSVEFFTNVRRSSKAVPQNAIKGGVSLGSKEFETTHPSFVASKLRGR